MSLDTPEFQLLDKQIEDQPAIDSNGKLAIPLTSVLGNLVEA